MDPEEKIRRLKQAGRVRIKIQARSDREPPDLRLLWGDHWVKQDLAEAFAGLGLTVEDESPDVILHLFGSPPKKPLPEDTLNMVWVHSHPDEVTPENLKAFDKIFCASNDFISRMEAMGYRGLDFLPACTGKTPVEVPIQYDVIFLGNARGRRPDGRAAVRDLLEAGLPFKVWGNGWDKLLGPDYYGGRYWDYSRIGELYAAARITVNDHHPDMGREGFVSNKVFDVLASGGFVISEKNPGLAQIFGESVPEYGSAAELRDLVEYYLEDEDARQARQIEGRKIALSYTYQACARQLAGAFRPI